MAQLIPVDHDPFASDLAIEPIDPNPMLRAERGVMAMVGGGGAASRVPGSQSVFPPGFSDKSSARVELNRTQRLIDKYSAKQQAWDDGGPAITPQEREDWAAAFKGKQRAQQYLDSSQGPPELIPVDHDPFSEGNPASAGQEAVSRLSNYKTEMEPGGQYVNLILPGGKSVGDYVPSHNELLRRAGVQGFDTIEDLGREMGLIRQHGNNNFELFGKAPDQSQLRQMMRTAKHSGDSSIFLDVWGPTGQLNSREFEFRETSHIPKWISEIAGREK